MARVRNEPAPVPVRMNAKVLDDPALVQEICDRLASGESMRSITADPRMPPSSQVYLRMAQDESFRSNIVAAREAQQEALIDQTVDMADDATPEDHQVVKLRIWARQWRAGKLAPKKYGERVATEITGANGGPIQTETTLTVSNLTDDQLRALASIPLPGG